MTAEAIIALVGIVTSVVLGAFLLVFRFAVSQTLKGIEAKQGELEARVAKHEAKGDQSSDRLVKDEVATETLKGEVAVLKVKLEHQEADLAELKESHVPRAEWDRQWQHVMAKIDDLTKLVRERAPSPGRYGTGSSDPFVPVQKK